MIFVKVILRYSSKLCIFENVAFKRNCLAKIGCNHYSIVETNLVSILGTLLLTAITTKPRFVGFLPMLTIVKCSSDFLSVQPDGSARGN